MWHVPLWVLNRQIGSIFFAFMYIVTAHLVIDIKSSNFSHIMFWVLVWIRRKRFTKKLSFSVHNSHILYSKNSHPLSFWFWELRLLFTINLWGPWMDIDSFLPWGCKLSTFGIIWKKISILSQCFHVEINFWNSKLFSDPIRLFSTVLGGLKGKMKGKIWDGYICINTY